MATNDLLWFKYKNGSYFTNISGYYPYDKVGNLYHINAIEEIVNLTVINKVTGEVNSHIFDNTNGESFVEGYIYIASVTDLQGNVLVENKHLLLEGDTDPHSKVYGICNTKCMVEVPTKEEFNEHTADTGWKTLIAVGDYSGYSVTNRPVRYRKKNGIVYVNGHIATTSGSPTVATLPVGCRPDTKMYFPAHGYITDLKYASPLDIYVSADGVIDINNRTGENKMTSIYINFSFPV